MFSLEEKRILWVIGSLEKLGGLGFFSSIPLKISESSLDVYWEIDDLRESLISKEDIKQILYCLVIEGELEVEDFEVIYQLLITYYENREKIFSYGMKSIIA